MYWLGNNIWTGRGGSCWESHIVFGVQGSGGAEWSGILFSSISEIIKGQRGLVGSVYKVESLMVVIWNGSICLEVTHGIMFGFWGE